MENVIAINQDTIIAYVMLFMAFITLVSMVYSMVVSILNHKSISQETMREYVAGLRNFTDKTATKDDDKVTDMVETVVEKLISMGLFSQAEFNAAVQAESAEKKTPQPS